MPATQKAYNFVFFKIADIDDDPDDFYANRVALKLNAPWIRTAGTKPDINSAECPYPEFDKLQQFVPPSIVGDETHTVPAQDPKQFHRDGSIEFYFESQEEPDLILNGITIVEASPKEIGSVTITDDQGNASQITRGIVYEFFFADERVTFQPPRGGRLFNGKINGAEVKDEDLLSNSFLMTSCLIAMGFPNATAPVGVDLIPPIRGLQWIGAFAVDELNKILEHVGCVFILSDDQTKIVQIIGDGDDPEIPDGKLLAEIPIHNSYQSGKIVVVTSSPTPIIDSFDGSGVGWPQWRFVARSQDQKWYPIESLPDLPKDVAGATLTPEAVVRQGRVSQAGHFHYWDDLYRAIQLHDGDQIAPVSILRQYIPPDPASVPEEISVMARAVVTIVGIPFEQVDTAVPVSIEVQWMGGPGVLKVDPRMGRLDITETTQFPDYHFREALDDPLSVKFSCIAWDKNDPSRSRSYFIVGFTTQTRPQGDDPEIVQIDDDLARQIANAGSDDDAIVISMPELEYVRLNGIDDDGRRAALADIAKKKASLILQHSQKPVTTKTAIGFLPSELSGRVNKIAIDQERCITTFTIDGWYLPSAGLRRISLERDRQGAFPDQHESQPTRTFLGGIGQEQPAVPIAPPKPQAVQSTDQVWIGLSSFLPRSGVYNAFIAVEATNAPAIFDETDNMTGVEGINPKPIAWFDQFFTNQLINMHDVEVTAVNLAENGLLGHSLWAAGTGSGSDSASGSDPSLYRATRSSRLKDSTGRPVVFFHAKPNDEFWGMVYLARLIDGSTRRWNYDWYSVVFDGTNWVKDGRFDNMDTVGLQLLNSIEWINDTLPNGVLGNGVDPDNLPGTFDVVPIPAGVPIRVYRSMDSSGIVFFYTAYENSVDGSCP